MLNGKNILLMITGGIAAYKTPELARALKKAGADVTCVLSQSGARFVSELALQSVSGNRVYTDLFSLTDEHEMGHISLARNADLVIVAPATANTLAKAAHGIATNLITTLLLATTKPILLAPAMNWAMWENPATTENIKTLSARGNVMVGPVAGELACGEEGMGRMADIEDILSAAKTALELSGPLKGVRATVTSGPTFEPIDPVRYIANRSSGKQGHAIAVALAELGAEVTLISGPTNITPPEGIKLINVITANEMMAAVNAINSGGPTDIFVGAAAVSDWRMADIKTQKIKKQTGTSAPEIKLTENPDILKTVAAAGLSNSARPTLVIGFAAETENLIENARRKLAAKGCDWILANDVSNETDTFGGDDNQVHLVTRSGVEEWPRMNKRKLAKKLAAQIAETLLNNKENNSGLTNTRGVS
ncbi:MAG: bifunctional phosphopantothenoylcysteine decarboxylase/phosphopantothenate--cysteine ligase CoaBC [Rhodospirillaceae bacterium]|nr:bifunctional phosphopantothenoylcysteine decarboxylase/phosphopantothenate--cysteine ligase CoaBC [Rhodospirillaceae bacterium]